LMLGPLDDSTVHMLVEQIMRAPAPPQLLAVTAAAAGNPLFVTEVVRALQADGTLGVVEGSAQLTEWVMPASFSSLVLRQLRGLPDSVLRILRVAAVLGTSFSVTDLATTLGQSPSDLLDDLREALRAGFLQDEGGCLAFRHELVREAIY